MKYVAIYTLTPEIKNIILEALRDIVADSGYYGKHNNKYGSHLVSTRSSEGKWRETTVRNAGEVESLVDFIPTWEWVESLKQYPLGWTTCNLNHEHVVVNENNTITYTREGRRHGITSYYALQTIQPDQVLEYVSERSDTSPFAKGLTPTV